ncbi:oligosaccharide flippase family protein [bacterium]|nr:oligosaccharide flippase family protein [bacterium]
MEIKNINNAVINRIKSNSSYFVISASVLLARVLGGVITILIIRSISSSEFAAFSTGFFIMTILGYSTTGLDKSFVFEYIHQNRENNDSLIESYVWLKFIILVNLIIISIAILYFALPYARFNITLAILGILYSSSFWILTLILSMYQAEQDFKKYGLVQISFYMSVFVFVLLFMFIHGRTSYLFLLSYFIGIVGIIPFIIPFRRIKISYYKNEVLRLLNLSKWLITSELCWLLFIRMDYFTVSRYLPKDVLGEYAIALRSINIVSVLIASLSIYILPKVAEIRSDNQLNKFWKKSNFLTFSLFLLGVLIFIFSKQIITTLYGNDHSVAVRYFKSMIIAYAPMFFIPSFKYLILKFNNKIHYFLFNFILVLTYFVALPIFSMKISRVASPIYAKGAGFLIALLYGVILYYSRDKKKLQ